MRFINEDKRLLSTVTRQKEKVGFFRITIVKKRRKSAETMRGNTQTDADSCLQSQKEYVIIEEE